MTDQPLRIYNIQTVADLIWRLPEVIFPYAEDDENSFQTDQTVKGMNIHCLNAQRR